jgi:hypothetical protein
MSTAALLTVYSRPLTTFWGTGSYGYWSTAGPNVEALREHFGVPGYLISGAVLAQGSESDPPRPPSWPALIIEIGVVGIGLLTATIVSTGIRILRHSRPTASLPTSTMPYLLLLSISLIVAWGYVGEIQDFIFMYMMLMPFGVFDGWSDRTRESGALTSGDRA